MEQYVDAVSSEYNDCSEALTSWTDAIPWGLGHYVGVVVSPIGKSYCTLYAIEIGTLRYIIWESIEIIFDVVIKSILKSMRYAMIHFILGNLERIAHSLVIPTATLGSSPVYNDLLLVIYTILWPFYLIQTIYVAAYLMFAAIDPGQRAGAKVRLNNLVMSLILCGVAKPLFLIILQISNDMINHPTLGFFPIALRLIQLSCPVATISEGVTGLVGAYMTFGMSFFLIGFMMLFVLVIYLLLSIRLALVVLFYILFPAAIFFYFFDYTRQLGGDLIARAIMWLFMGPVMALMIALTVVVSANMLLDLTCAGGTVVVNGASAALHADVTINAPGSQRLNTPAPGFPQEFTMMDDTEIDTDEGYPRFTANRSDDPNLFQRFIGKMIGMFLFFGCFAAILIVPLMMTSLMKWVGGAIAASGMVGMVGSKRKVERWRNFGKIAVGGALMGQGTRGMVSAATQASWMQPQAPVSGGGLFPTGNQARSFLSSHTPSSMRSGRFGSMVNSILPASDSPSKAGGGKATGTGGQGGGSKVPILSDLAGVFLSDRKNMADTTKYWAALDGAPDEVKGAGAGPSSAGTGRGGGDGSGASGAIKHVDETSPGGGLPRSPDASRPVHSSPSDGRSPGNQNQAFEISNEQTMSVRQGSNFDKLYGTVVPSMDMMGRFTTGFEGALTLGRGIVRMFTPGASVSLRRAARTDVNEGGKKVFYMLRPLSFLMPIRTIGRVIYGVTPEFLPPAFQPAGLWLGRNMAGLSFRQMGRRNTWGLKLTGDRMKYESLNQQMKQAKTPDERQQIKAERDAVGKGIIGTMDKLGYGYESSTFQDEFVRDWDYYRRQMGKIQANNPDLYRQIMAESSDSLGMTKGQEGSRLNAVSKRFSGEVSGDDKTVLDNTCNRLAGTALAMSLVNGQRARRGETALAQAEVTPAIVKTELQASLSDGTKDAKTFGDQVETRSGRIENRMAWGAELNKTYAMGLVGISGVEDQRDFDKKFGKGMVTPHIAGKKSHVLYSAKGTFNVNSRNMSDYFDGQGNTKEGMELYVRDDKTHKQVPVVGAFKDDSGNVNLVMDDFKAKRYYELKGSYLSTAGNNEFTFHKDLYQTLRAGGYTHEQALNECKTSNIHMHEDNDGRLYVDMQRLGYISQLKSKEGELAREKALGNGRLMDEDGVGLVQEDAQFKRMVGKLRRGKQLGEDEARFNELKQGKAHKDAIETLEARLKSGTITEPEFKGLVEEASRHEGEMFDKKMGQLNDLQAHDMESFISKISDFKTKGDKKLSFVLSETGFIEDTQVRDLEADLVKENGGRIIGTAIHELTKDEVPKRGEAVRHKGQRVELFGRQANMIEGDRLIIIESEFGTIADSHTIVDSHNRTETIDASTSEDRLKEISQGDHYMKDDEGNYVPIRGATVRDGKVTLTRHKYLHAGQWVLSDKDGHQYEILASSDLENRGSIELGSCEKDREVERGKAAMDRILDASPNSVMTRSVADKFEKLTPEERTEINGRAKEHYETLRDDLKKTDEGMEYLNEQFGGAKQWDDLTTVKRGTESVNLQIEIQRGEVLIDELKGLRYDIQVRQEEIDGLLGQGYSPAQVNDTLWTVREANQAFNDGQRRRAIMGHLDPGRSRRGKDDFNDEVDGILRDYKAGRIDDDSLREKLDKEGVRLNSVELYHDPSDTSAARVMTDGMGADLKVNMGFHERLETGVDDPEFNEYLRNNYLTHEFRHAWARNNMGETVDRVTEGDMEARAFKGLVRHNGEETVHTYMEEFIADYRGEDDSYGEDLKTQLESRDFTRNDVLNMYTRQGIQSRQDLLNIARFSVEEEIGLKRQNDQISGYENYGVHRAQNDEFAPEDDKTSFDSLVESKYGNGSTQLTDYHIFKRVLLSSSTFI
ncbi:hypothetical protein ACFLRF_03670 [Candidatus Altiarchaeota archaeon]